MLLLSTPNSSQHVEPCPDSQGSKSDYGNIVKDWSVEM